MDCKRCQGLMSEDHFIDFEGTAGSMWMKGWRCLNCGSVVDPLIEVNRRLHQATVLALAQEQPEYEEEDVHLGAETIIAMVIAA